ncbi:hypothetical protein HPT27_01175 [Permianibacter sp. IMCC34836]|uniref:hypothetical protein n=1 Tax=Permianibacter fluminis TaxID=2738515 RepID=UPI0015574266|nr:hypothetical protein [Permianibacter fluminis]NQD35613.1 hypothetical protein [Permianibacter fluminis]
MLPLAPLTPTALVPGTTLVPAGLYPAHAGTGSGSAGNQHDANINDGINGSAGLFPLPRSATVPD